MGEYKKYVQKMSILLFSSGLILAFLFNPKPEFNIQNVVLVIACILCGAGFGVVVGAPNLRKQKVIDL